MATVWFVRDGEGDHHTNNIPQHVDVQKVVALLGKYDVRYSEAGPVINPGRKAAWIDDYKHIVVEIEANEVSERFEKPGFYYVVGLLPREAARLFDIPNP